MSTPTPDTAADIVDRLTATYPGSVFVDTWRRA